MKNKNLIIGGVAFLLAGVGLFFIVRGSKKDDKKDDSTTPPPIPELPLPAFQKYTVETLVSNLNVRQSPSTSSAVIGSLPKGSVVFAKPSGTSGWYTYSADGVKDTGFVSSLYLKAI